MRHIGVEVAATEVRVVEVSHIDASGLAVISKLSKVALPDGAVVAGRIRNHAQVGFALKAAIREARVPKYGFVIGLGAPDVAVARVKMPALVEKHEREGVLRTMEFDLATTFRVADAAISTYLIDDDPFVDENEQELNATYVKQSDLEDLLGVCDLAKLEPRAVDLSAAALLRSLQRVGAGDKAVSTLVDVGASKTTVITRAGMHMRSIRVVAQGGIEITKAIAAATNQNFPVAERIKYDLTPNTTARTTTRRETFGSEVEEEVITVQGADPGVMAAGKEIKKLADLISQGVESDGTTHEQYTSGITLTGRGALQRGLKEAIEELTGVPVAVGMPWATIERTTKNAEYLNDGNPDQLLLLSLSTAIGRAIWPGDGK